MLSMLRLKMTTGGMYECICTINFCDSKSKSICYDNSIRCELIEMQIVMFVCSGDPLKYDPDFKGPINGKQRWEAVACSLKDQFCMVTNGHIVLT